MESNGYSNFLGSSVANLAFGAVLALILWLKRKIRVSKCKTNCHWFECESQLANLENVRQEVNTQRGLLQDVLMVLDQLKTPQPVQPALLSPPDPAPVAQGDLGSPV